MPRTPFVPSRSGRLTLAVMAVAILIAAPQAAGAKSTDAKLAAQIDAVMSEAYAPDAPGAAVIVTRGGDVILRKGYGMADLEHGLPISPDHVFRIGSLTKQFTAVAILMLLEEGRLSLDDSITRFLPQYPTHGLTITVENLLTHTSGIQSYTDQSQYSELMRRDYTVAEMIARFQDDPMVFPPGSRWQYNNSGYFLLGAVIEQVTGRTWSEFLQERIFDAVGMTGTYADRHEHVIPRRVHGYEPDPHVGGWLNASYVSMTQPYAAGAMLSTVDDLAAWDRALYTGKLVRTETLARAWTASRLADGSSAGYGYGWLIGEWLGSRVISHGGGINGFVCEAVHCPDERVFVAVLTNRPGVPPGPGLIARKAAALAMGKPWEPQPVAVAADVLQRYVGVYRIDAQATRTLTYEGGKLYSQRTGGARQEVQPMSPTSFFYADSFSHFAIELDPSGAVRGMTMRTMGGEPQFAALTDEQPVTRQIAAVDAATLERHVGRYELAPTFILTVTRDGDQLWTQATGQPRLAIYPESATQFFLTEVDAQIEFQQDADGRTTELILMQAGRRMPAKRLPD